MTTALSHRTFAPTPFMLVSPLLGNAGFRHAFFTREGGKSRGPFASLNGSSATGDDPTEVAANLRIAAAALGVRPERFFVVSQVHGTSVRFVDVGDYVGDVASEPHDAILTAAPETACAVRVADCVPVLVADRATGTVLAIHSGWQGTEKNVVAAAILAARQRGASGDLLAAIGPHIESCCFEVGSDVAARLAACSPAKEVVLPAVAPLAGPRAGEVAPPTGTADTARPHVDLRAIVRAQLIAAGLRDETIDDVRGCTRCDAARFYSFRRDGQKSGRLIAAIRAGRD